MFIKRETCALCEASLSPFFCLPQFPLNNNPTSQPIEADILCDYQYGVCDNCKSVQLITLLEPSLLYNSDNKVGLTALWKEHHETFSKFILNYLSDKCICEIGGGSNNLSSFLPNIQKYTILDLYEPSIKQEEITYILGNCESFSDYTASSIVLCHTFEHLYYPRKFLESVAKSNVQQIFISVPDLKTWLKESISPFLIFNQHTFYFEEEDLIALFSQYGFHCLISSSFQNHSLFFYFKRTPTEPIPIPMKTVADDIYINFQKKNEFQYKKLTNKNAFIMPSFYPGQIAHFFLKQHTILGFLDNDINKINKRLYGTPLSTYSPNKIKEYSEDSITVFLVKTPYYQEMHSQIRSLSPDVEIITIII